MLFHMTEVYHHCCWIQNEIKYILHRTAELLWRMGLLKGELDGQRAQWRGRRRCMLFTKETFSCGPLIPFLFIQQLLAATRGWWWWQNLDNEIASKKHALTERDSVCEREREIGSERAATEMEREKDEKMYIKYLHMQDSLYKSQNY